MPRPERAVDPSQGPVQLFAWELRRLRDRAGRPGYREMAARVHYSPTSLSVAAAGRRLPTLAVALAYVRACGGDVREWEGRWRAVAADLALAPHPSPPSSPNPYRRPESDDTAAPAPVFGRDELVDRLHAGVARHGVTALTGPSGAGKSTLLGAAFPGGRSHGRTTVVVRLTGDRSPLTELTGGLAHLSAERAHLLHRAPRTGARRASALLPRVSHAGADRAERLLVVDQFERVFDRPAAERTAFLDALAGAAAHPRDRVRLVLGLRSDHVGPCLRDPWLARVLSEARVRVTPMTAGDLEAMITEPADAHGLVVERALMLSLIDDTVHRPGGLPFARLALAEVWRRRRGFVMSLDGYRSFGGVPGLVAQTARSTLRDLAPLQRVTAEAVLERLTAFGGLSGGLPRPCPRGKLDFAPPVTSTVIRALVDARLLVADEGTLSLAHEAVIGVPGAEAPETTPRPVRRSAALTGYAALAARFARTLRPPQRPGDNGPVSSRR
ncbi:helix-turn-helix domain-containing protein [Thermomonospora umbrina]|uniref:HTH cro/C1-type domain-containing protein n=1 Tax=Thermomonospora umbrina TaxID=111806 RepID=A0A3D9SKC2_9ACTN|nr:helix-turn-helix domain-containing protein [Thermomonospora umbrina]REE96167.1 hypothetical protein DFJ69_1592 [Thermomonospora umbrina]